MKLKFTSITSKPLQYCWLSLIFCFLTLTSQAQGSLTTTYAMNSGLAGGNSGITFVVQNTNATSRVITQIDQMWNTGTTVGTATAKLWMSTTSLSGGGTVSSPNWTLIATSPVINVTTSGLYPTFTNLSIIIPAGAQYRFAIESSNGVTYGTTGSTPNNFTADGIVLKTGNAQIAGANVGYAINPMPNLFNNPRYFGGKITWALETLCSGTPAPGNTQSTLTSACPGYPFTLSTPFAPVPGTTGLSYQWQSASSATGPWSDIVGASSPTYTTTQTATTFYQLNVTCSNSGASGTSTPIQVIRPAICYCLADATDTDPLFEKIGNVKFGTINNSSVSDAGYEDFTALTPVSDFVTSGSYPITVEGDGDTYSGDVVAVWIDYNQDGDFTDAGENVYKSTAQAGPYTGTITIPATATPGNTRMRIRLFDSVFGNGVSGPCGSADYGQVEDYTINIVACTPVIVTSQPTDKSVECGTDATFKVTATGPAPSYQWQFRPDAATAWQNIFDASQYAGFTTNNLTVLNPSIALNGYQYRVLITNPCGAEISTPATLTVTAFTPTITPPTTTICKGQVQQISITNIAVPVTSPYISSGPLNITIPDNNIHGSGANIGISNAINVTSLPAGAIIKDLSVKLNIAHSWVGDLIVVLKSPNGKIYNLDYALTSTGGAGPTTGFTNTEISSKGTATLASGSDPYTGIFAADNQDPATAVSTIPLGPAGFIPDTRNISDLYTGAGNGNWTIALYDWYDDYTVTNALIDWSISFTYGAPQTGVFSPSTGLYTDAAATVAYTGTPVNTIYASPASTTNYTLVVTNPVCTSTPLTIPVTVITAPTAATVSSQVTCAGSSTSFTASVTGGNGYTYQWQVSTDGGVNYSNVANNSTYSGATTGVLTLTNVPAAWDGYKYRVVITASPCDPTTTLTSTEGTLTVNPTPVVTLAAAPYTSLLPGLTTTLTATVTPNAGATYSWYKDGVVVATTTTNSIVVNSENLGTYTVAVSDINSCNTTTSTPSSIAITDSVSKKVFIYPNPSNGLFDVVYHSTPNNTKLVRGLNIYDAKGARVYFENYSIDAAYQRMHVDMRKFSTGTYWVEVVDANGNRLAVGRVVIVR